MTTPAIADELGIRSGYKVAVLHAPEGIVDLLAPLPDGVELRHGVRREDVVDRIIGFVTERAHLAKNIGWLVTTLAPGGVFWVARPVAGSEMTTDLDEAVIAEVAGSHGLVTTATAAVGPEWTAVAVEHPA